MMTKPTRIAVLLGSLGLCGSLPAGATIVDGLTAYAQSAAGTATDSDGPNSAIPFVTAYSNAVDGQVDAGSIALGITNGVYYVSAGVNGNNFAHSEFTRTWGITNTTGVAQSYSFSFYIYGGSMYAFDSGYGGNGYAQYVLDILFGSSNLFHSAVRIDHDGTLTTSGTALSGATHSVTPYGSTYSWGGTLVTLDLGILGPGQTSLLQYDLTAHAFGTYNFGPCGGGGGYGYGDEPGDGVAVSLAGFTVFTCTGFSVVSMGDPDGLNATPVQSPSITGTPQAVPAPGTLGLLGISLAALMAVRRRARVN
jgi:hypothetical protein